MKSISESLAGRSATVELHPFYFRELSKISIKNLWFFGGYPRLSQLTKTQKGVWLDEYIHSFIERDIPALGISISTLRLRRLFQMLSHYHGGILNVSKLASSLSCSTTAIYDALDILEQSFLIRRLQPYHANMKKRLVKSPKIYIRDTGILHRLWKINTFDDLLGYPDIGSSWEGFVIEQLITDLKCQGQKFDVFFYHVHSGTEIDLVIDVNNKRILIEIKLGTVNDKRSLKGLNETLANIQANEAWIINFPGESFISSENVYHMSLAEAADKLIDL